MSPVRSLRKQHGLSLHGLAKLAGVSRPVIANAERGVRPGPESRRKIAAALEVDEDRLWPEIGSIFVAEGAAAHLFDLWKDLLASIGIDGLTGDGEVAFEITPKGRAMIHAAGGASYFRDADGGILRAVRNGDGTISYATVHDDGHLEQVALAGADDIEALRRLQSAVNN